ncbi:MAG: transcriptional regulator, TetR family [Blastococcus sp.]|nr:transcriptional regulator, TetR family [Blastococcus sp.]
MGERIDRRALKKARTREQIRDVAQRLFDERGFESVTIAEIARAADVAVQTVFNHFATKEELFFDGRTLWLDGPAEAVRSRPSSVPPLAALRVHLVGSVRRLVESHSCPLRRRYIATLESSEPLRVHEREQVHEAEQRLGAALLNAWSADAAAGRPAPQDPATLAALVSAVWLAGVRALVVGRRPDLADGADPGRTAIAAMELTDRVLRHLEGTVGLIQDQPTDAETGATGWPQPAPRAS